MTRITIDESLRKKLHDLCEPLELCDADGRLLARVTPIGDLSEYEPWEPEMMTAEEIQRRLAEKRYTTEQVLAHLTS